MHHNGELPTWLGSFFGTNLCAFLAQFCLISGTIFAKFPHCFGAFPVRFGRFPPCFLAEFPQIFGEFIRQGPGCLEQKCTCFSIVFVISDSQTDTFCILFSAIFPVFFAIFLAFFWKKFSIFLAIFLSFFAGFPAFFGEVFRTFWRISGTVSEGSKQSLPLTDGNAFVCSCCCHPSRVAPLPSPKISPIFLKINLRLFFANGFLFLAKRFLLPSVRMNINIFRRCRNMYESSAQN